MRSLSGVDSIIYVNEIVVENVARSEAEGWSAGVYVAPLVESIGDSQVAPVLACIVVAMANERRLEMVMEVAVRHGDIVAAVCNVKKAVIVVLSSISYSFLLVYGCLAGRTLWWSMSEERSTWSTHTFFAYWIPIASPVLATTLLILRPRMITLFFLFTLNAIP